MNNLDQHHNNRQYIKMLIRQNGQFIILIQFIIIYIRQIMIPSVDLISSILENNFPKCINNNICYSLCSVQKCKENSFMCKDQSCICFKNHMKCIKCIKWIQLKDILTEKLTHISEDNKKYVQKIQEIYNKCFKDLEQGYYEFKKWAETIGINQYQKKLYQFIKEKQFHQINGQFVYQMQKNLNVVEINQTHVQIQIQLQLVLNQINKLKDLFQKKQKSQRIQSKIIMYKPMIQSYFEKQILKMQLLYRASQNQFSTDIFHEKCDRIQNTLTLVKTEFGNVIGAFTHLQWDIKKHDKYQIDYHNQSFLFSLNDPKPIPLIQDEQNFAIYHYRKRGPLFGYDGNDLHIGDKANLNRNSGANIGKTYDNGNYELDNQACRKRFSGQSNGYKFRIIEWQVFKVIFN